MRGFLSKLGLMKDDGRKELADKMRAVNRAQAVIEFDVHGNILDANDNFLNVMGYRHDEVVGKHHSMFVEGDLRNSQEYRDFWIQLGQGKAIVSEFKRVGKQGNAVWIHASYNPLLDDNGRPYKIVKFATDITQSKVQAQLANALKLCQANVMLADINNDIVYMNDTVTQMMTENEQKIRKEISSFSVKKLLGSSIDDFHKKPEHQRRMLSNLSDPYKTDIKIGELVFGLIATPWYDTDGVRIGTLVEWDDKTERLAQEREAQKISEENARVRQALDNVTANVMIADGDANIIYVNKAVVKMMQTAESDIRKELQHFDSSKLLGSNMDQFHKNPHHQRSLLQELRGTYRGKAAVGGRRFTLIANPVYKDAERVGTVMEWADRTAEIAIEEEIDQMVEAANKGDFSRNLVVDGKEGFFLNLSRGLNSLVSTMEVALNDVVRMLGAMAKGDLSERITRDYEGAFGELKRDANLTADKLTEVIARIRVSASAIASSADEIAQGNADLSQRTEEQASSLEETAASMEEMTSTVRQSADNAVKANAMTVAAQKLARDGGRVVKEAVSAMEEINKSSKRISDIISVIDEIAFQTNLLALNAAVEAARAGEQGRGFAVVAGEVRNLAQRSAAAAKEIKDLIRDSSGKVEDGTSLVNQSGDVLRQIVTSVDEVTVMMQEIAAAANEQSSGIEQVNTAVTQMDEMTQQNAALVEEASAAGQAMSDQARSMNKVVEFFSKAEEFHSEDNVHGFASEKTSPKREKSRSAGRHINTAGKNDEWEEF